MKALIIIRDSIGRVIDFAGALAGILILLVSIFVTWGVIARYFFLASHWVEPVSVYLFLASSFLATSAAMKKMEHIRVDILIHTFSPIMKKVTDTITTFIALLFFSYVSWRCFVMFKNSYDRESTDLSILEVPLWIPQIFVFIGLVFLCLAILRHIIVIWTVNNYDRLETVENE